MLLSSWVRREYLLDHSVGDQLRAAEVRLGVIPHFEVVQDHRFFLACLGVEFGGGSIRGGGLPGSGLLRNGLEVVA